MKLVELEAITASTQSRQARRTVATKRRRLFNRRTR